jgi:hypothetical protein
VIVVKLKAFIPVADNNAGGILSKTANISGFPSYAENLVIPIKINTMVTPPQISRDLKFAFISRIKMFISSLPYTEWIFLL